MELLRGTAPKVKFYGPTPDTEIASATYSVNGVAPVTGTFTPVANETSTWEMQLPYISTDDNFVEVVWEFTIPGTTGTFSETFSYETVTPYLSKQEIKAIVGPDATDEEVWDVEAAVRHIINANTGQKFGFDRNKTLTVEGHGEQALRLPERLVVLTGLSTLTSNLDPQAAIITSDGWYLKKAWANELGPRTTASVYWGDYTNDNPFDNNIYSDPNGDGLSPFVGPLSSRPGGVIVAPGTSGRATPWKQDYPFDITGDWGYVSVPEPVRAAAKLLINDYACAEQAFRDRYLESMKAADWRLQFNSRAWESTGNVRADQLLSEFVMMDWAVV
jgi:hypothetical protein